MYDEPRHQGQTQSRWTLATIRDTCAWLQGHTLSGVWQLLDRLGLSWKRAREYVHSPDPHYQAKLDWLALVESLVLAAPSEHVLLYLDELTYYRQPTLANAYALRGERAVRARRSYQANSARRIVAAMNAHTGEVLHQQAAHLRVPTLVDFYVRLCQHYQGAQLWVVQDNWPVHTHPDLLAALERQETPFPWYRPSRWSNEARPTARRLNLPVQLVLLPTYAPWTNPIEKLWRWLKQEVLHVHPWADDLAALRAAIDRFLNQFHEPSEQLLRYVGLPVPT